MRLPEQVDLTEALKCGMVYGMYFFWEQPHKPANGQEELLPVSISACGRCIGQFPDAISAICVRLTVGYFAGLLSLSARLRRYLKPSWHQ